MDLNSSNGIHFVLHDDHLNGLALVACLDHLRCIFSDCGPKVPVSYDFSY